MRATCFSIGQTRAAFHVMAHAHLSTHTHTDVHRKQGTCKKKVAKTSETYRKFGRQQGECFAAPSRSIRWRNSLEQGQQK